MTTACAAGDGTRPRRISHSLSGVMGASEESLPEKRLRPDRPCHSYRDSLFSTSSGYSDYRGFLNLCIILLVLSNARVAIENILKYGILVDPLQWLSVFLKDPYHWPCASLVCLSNIYILFSLMLERGLAAQLIGEYFGAVLHALNTASVLIVPAAIVLYTDPNPVGSCFCLGIHSILFFKLVSYAHVNFWCRNTRQLSSSASHYTQHGRNGQNSSTHSSKTCLIEYPDNLTVGAIYYFMFAPTLCYELNYPRTGRIRKWFVAKRLGEAIFLSQLILALSQQWIVPLLRNSLVPLNQMELGRMLERLLKLSVPNHLIWLIGFYWLFHSCMNFTAEVLRFADREFYLDWWNAETIQYFWQTWNIPVHKWCVRHLYKPLTAAGWSRFQSACAVFLVSAFFHEYLVSVPLRMFRLWAFSGMLAQMPLQYITFRFATGKYGNMIVWMALILGQPLAIFMYFHDYYILHYGISKSE